MKDDKPAAVSLPLSLTGLVQPGAVVQSNCPILFRGRCSPGQRVTVELASYQCFVKSDDQGWWRCSHGALPAGGPYLGRVFCNDGQMILLDDIYAGEVWLCAGQSNMAMPLSALVPEDQPDGPGSAVVRFANIKPSVSGKPKETLAIHWQDAHACALQASGVGYLFARELGQRQGVPVGFVQAAVGHTPAMSWTSRERIPPDSFAATMLERFDQLAREDPCMMEDLESLSRLLAPRNTLWNKAISAWQPQAKAALEQALPLPPMPEFPTGPGSKHTPCVLYNAMIAPLAGETMAGVLWYQGETDAILGLHEDYERSLLAVMASLRDTLGRVPLVVVEIPRHRDIQSDHPDETWPSVRQAQRQVVRQAEQGDAIGLTPTLDLGETWEIHPARKKILSMRAASIAMATAYPTMVSERENGQAATGCHGPIFERAEFTATNVTIYFTGVKGRLMIRPLDKTSNSGEPARFELYTNGQWHSARPQLMENHRVLLDTKEPAQGVRYAWACDPLPILFDEADLPVSSFRACSASDDS